MFQKEVLVFGSIASAVFVAVALFASRAVRTVHRDSKMLAEDTLPGLVNAGDAINRMNENWFNAHLLLSMNSREARSNLVQKINANSTEPLWQRYNQAIFDKRDAELFSQVENRRAQFLAGRNEYFKLIETAKISEATTFFETNLEPLFSEYRSSAVNIFRLDAGIGQQRADRIIRFSWWTPYALGAFCVMVLLAGIFVGFKASLGAFSGGWNPRVKIAGLRPEIVRD